MRINWKLRRAADLILLSCILLGTRIPFRSHYLYDIDSVNFALGLKRFDPRAHQPHPPGYFLYIFLGRALNTLFSDANTAFVAIAIAASCGALVLIYVLAENWLNRQAALFASLIFLFSPLVWFHGTVALIYPVEAFFSALTGYLCWRITCGSSTLVIPAAVTLGLAAGFRPSSLLFLIPLFFFALRGVGRRRVVTAIGVLAVTILCWGIPMMWLSGGIQGYGLSLLSLWQTAPGKQTGLGPAMANSIARIFSLGLIAILCLGCAVLLIFYRSPAAIGMDRRKKFTWVWVGPGLLFFSFVFLKFVNSGYLLVITPPVFVWLGIRASQWYSDLRFHQRAKIALVTASAAANSFIFLFAPVYCSYASVRHFEAELKDVLCSLPRMASPTDTMIVGFDSHFLGYRHAGYYLPGWFTAQYPEVRLAPGMRIFEMEHGDTQLVDTLPPGRFKNFILFPLPTDDAEYQEYMNGVRARFPKGTLRIVSDGHHEFAIGAVADLPLLFPHSVPHSVPAVYAGNHATPGSVDRR